MKIITRLLFTLPILLVLHSCNTNVKKKSMEKWKKEIVDTEQEFAEMAMKEGIPKAFLTYAANDAVLLRNNTLIIGIDSLRESYKDKESDLKKFKKHKII